MTSAAGAVGVELSVIHTGDIPAPSGYVYRAVGNAITRLRAGLTAGEDSLLMPCLAFVLRHPSSGVILIDTGFHRSAQTSLRSELGVPMSLLLRGLRPAHRPFDDQLREQGIEPDSVRLVVMTHLHVDHTSGMRLLPHANFTISRAEWRAARGRFAAARGYVGAHLPPENRVELVDLQRDGLAYGPFEQTHDLLGDGSVRLLSTPGHTRGHMSVLVHLVDGRRVLLVGDAAYTGRNIRDDLLPMLTDDDEESRRSLSRLRQLIEEDPEALVVPSHDPDAWRNLPE